MKNFLVSSLIVAFLISSVNSQFSNDFKLKESKKLLNDNTSELNIEKKFNKDNVPQLKTRKTVNMYFGAGYSFVIFTNNVMNSGYPVLDTKSGDFLSEVNLYFGFAIAKALTLEFEPSILFTRNNRSNRIDLTTPISYGGNNYYYDFPSTQSMLAFPLAVNARFFPFFKLPTFFRLFFVGAGAGVIWVHEDNDHNFSLNSYYNYYDPSNYFYSSATSQWAPLFRIMTGFTGSGGAFGFGGEIRYNIIPLKNNGDPFRTRIAKNFNSVDIAARFYFSL